MLVKNRYALRTHKLSFALFLTVTIIAFILLGIEVPLLALVLLLLAVAGLILHAKAQIQELVNRVDELQEDYADLQGKLENSREETLRHQKSIAGVVEKSMQFQCELHEVREALSSLSLVLTMLKRSENIKDNSYLQRMEAGLTRIVLQFSRIDTCLHVQIPEMKNFGSESVPSARQVGSENARRAEVGLAQPGLVNSSPRTFFSAAVQPACAEVD